MQTHIGLRSRDMINYDEEYFKVYDCIILDEIGKNPDLSFNKLSTILRCSKSMIIDRIEEFIEKGLIDIDNEQFLLTEYGHEMRLSIENYSYNKACVNRPYTTEEFNWEIAYFPSEDIFD